MWHPLAAAVEKRHHNLVVWLLSVGADPNGDSILLLAAVAKTAAILQLLIDAGGDVNRKSGSRPPLFWAVHKERTELVGLLLAHPRLDLTVTYNGQSPEQYAHDYSPALIGMLAQEVSGGVFGAHECLFRAMTGG